MNELFDVLKKRRFIDAVSSEHLKERFQTPLKVYIGFDPTAESLHLGNLVGIVALLWFQKYGHTPVVVLGGGTGKIGDPSGKSVERPLLSAQELEENVKQLSCQFSSFFETSKENPPLMILNNDTWLSSHLLIDFLRDVGKHFRLGPMLAKESVRSRLYSEEGMSFTEFSYQVLQGYDFYHLYRNKDICLQMGGSDQWGNITAGIELTRKLLGKMVYGMTYPLLTRSDGSKFGKSEEGAIWLDPKKTSPYQFYQYLIGVSDAEVIPLMQRLTFIEDKEIEIFRQEISSGSFTPFKAQKKLAENLTLFVHGHQGLKEALRATEILAPGSKGTLDEKILDEIAKDMPPVCLPFSGVVNQKFVDVAAQAKLVTSRGEGRRLIKNGGAYLNNEKILDVDQMIEKKHLIGNKYLLFSSGKKRKLLIKVFIS